MKKFAFIFFFLTVSLSGFSLGWDTTNILKFNFNPTLLGQYEYGGTFEYHLYKYISFEAGGAAFVNDRANANGLTIRTGIRIYTKSGFYFNPLFFYKYQFYNDREYNWHGDCERSKVFETGPRFCGAISETEYSYSMIADEYKQVTGVQMLCGWEFVTKIGISFDMYVGFGLRYKYREIEISSYTVTGGPIYGTGAGTTYYSPPKKEIIDGYFPSMQGGFQIGFPLIRKKH